MGAQLSQLAFRMRSMLRRSPKLDRMPDPSLDLSPLLAIRTFRTEMAPLTRIKDRASQYRKSFSFPGLVVASLFFAASVTPSLVPRSTVVQGLLSGTALAVGYGVGVLAVWLWQFMELPKPPVRGQRIAKWVSTAACAIVLLVFLRQMTFWQNSIRELMEMEPVRTVYCWSTALIAIVSAAAFVAFTRALIGCGGYCSRKLNRFLPRRVSQVLSAIVVVHLFLFTVNGLLAKSLLHAADSVFAELDELIDDGVERPTLATASGGPDSLIEWDSIGRRGKNFVVGAATQEELTEFLGREAKEPLRVYVGLRSRPSTALRARLALNELKRVGGFDRSVLVVATPTGTGWLDDSAVDTIEYLHGGDTAIVSMQYSYLPSWLTILVEPDLSREAAHGLFDEVYNYWTSIPRDSRPKLYLFGLSLGALGCEEAADLKTVFEDPIQGAVWSGPPFPSRQWAEITRNRNQGTPSWLPEYRDSSMLRFTGQKNALKNGRRWGPIRNVYIQYASDPMTFFSPDLLFQRPDWLIGERGPDVSPYLSWYPIVTFLQIGFDLPLATSPPIGYGHSISPANYIDAWMAVTAPAGWTEAEVERLKQVFTDRSPSG